MRVCGVAAGVRLDDSNELKMMRTRSTKTLDDKSPQEKWQAMFRTCTHHRRWPLLRFALMFLRSVRLGMFQEWRRHTTLAEAQRLYVLPASPCQASCRCDFNAISMQSLCRAEKDAKALKREQVAKLRAAVYTLQQKKHLTQSDQQLLQQLSQRLRMLHNT